MLRVLLASLRSLPSLLLALPAFLGACSCGEQPVCQGGRCTTAEPCAALGCAAHQLCEDAEGGARCVEACDNGYLWDGSGCAPPPEGCDACAAENRVCVQDACGDCLEGHVEDEAGSCVPWATCDPAPAAGSILDTCNGEHRVCVETTLGAAACGSCLAGYVENEAGACEEVVTCAELAATCEARNQLCVEEPNGHCEGCVAGHLPDEDGEGCRLPLTCEQVSATCSPGSICVEPAGVQDAYCEDDGCPGNALLGSDGVCHACPPCDNAANGEDGPYLDGLTPENQCVCRTLPGFFWKEGNFPRVEPCDADGDGWTRIAAKNAMDKRVTEPDNPVAVNARCEVRVIDRILLENEAGDVLERTLGQAVPLYESDRNDDALKLALDLEDPSVNDVVELSPGRPPRAEELNGLAKACVNGQADFNGNGLADVNEWHTNQELTSVPEALRPLVDYAYFVELHDAWYEAPTSGNGPGAYRIREKSRTEGPPTGIALRPEARSRPLPAADGGVIEEELDFWRTCSVFTDPALVPLQQEGLPLTGLDFATVRGEGFGGLNHHSQFKCLVLVDQHGPADPPSYKTRAELSSEQLTPNVCVAGETLQPSGIDAQNPSAPAFTCEADVTLRDSLVNGDVFWAVVEYRNYEVDPDDPAPDSYQGGCVNECVEFRSRCPGYDAADPYAVACEGDLLNFGKLFCGCNNNRGGPACDLGCASADLFLSPGYVAAPRQGLWLCGRPSGSTGELLFEAGTEGEPLGWTLRGEVPTVAMPRGELCADAGPDPSCTGYRLSPSRVP